MIVNASDLIELGSNAIVSASTSGSGKGGNLTINTRQLIIRDGVQVQTATFDRGAGGTLTVNASESIELIGTSVDNASSGLFVSGNLNYDGFPLIGDAGNLIVNTGRLVIRNGAALSAINQGLGRAGNIEIIAPSILLDNGANIRATASVGDRGNITVRSQDLQMRRGSQITTNATGSATGGNITIDTGVLTALENSDISANSQAARGGRVFINAQGIFGTQGRSQQTPNSDITATGGTPELSGTVEIRTPDVNPTSDLLVLPQTPVDVTSLIDRRCSGGNPQSNRFVNVGRGGKPPTPDEPLNSSTGWVDARQPLPQSRPSTPAVTVSPEDTAANQLVEVQGWALNAKGEIELVANAASVTPYSSGIAIPICNGGSEPIQQ